MAQTSLNEEEIAGVLTLYVQDDGWSLGGTYSPEAVWKDSPMRYADRSSALFVALNVRNNNLKRTSNAHRLTESLWRYKKCLK